MPLPEAITTCALQIGPLSDFAGDAHSFKVEWQPVLDGLPLAGNVRSITWEATGLALASFSEKSETSVGGTITADLPHVDQAGFIDGSGDAFTGWTYRVKVTARDSSRKTYSKTKYFAPVVGQDTADFDLIPDGTVGVPVSSPTATVTSYNGATGAITGPSVADVTEVADALVALADEVDGKQPLGAILTQFVELAAEMTNGQYFKWDATLGEPVAANPTGNSTNAAAIVTTGGAGTAFSSVAATVVGSAISVTDSGGRPVSIDFDGCFVQTTVGTGTAHLMIYETTGGSNTYRISAKAPLPNSIAANLANQTWGLHRLPIGVVTTTRTFELRAIILVASGTPVAAVANATTNPTIIQAINQ